jgi:hypothetical protein
MIEGFNQQPLGKGIYSGVRMFAGDDSSSTPRALREGGFELERKPLTDVTDGGHGQMRSRPI